VSFEVNKTLLMIIMFYCHSQILIETIYILGVLIAYLKYTTEVQDWSVRVLGCRTSVIIGDCQVKHSKTIETLSTSYNFMERKVKNQNMFLQHHGEIETAFLTFVESISFIIINIITSLAFQKGASIKVLGEEEFADLEPGETQKGRDSRKITTKTMDTRRASKFCKPVSSVAVPESL